MTHTHGDRRITIALIGSLIIHFLFLLAMNIPIPSFSPADEEIQVVFKEMEIVDVDRPDLEKRPKKSRFLGLFDSTAEEEQVAPTQYIPPSRRRIVEGVEGPSGDDKPGEGARYAAIPARRGERQREDGQDLVSVLPEEFFPDVKIGNKTYLNVFRYNKIAYFVRLKKIFRLTWNPHPVVMQHLFAHQITTGSMQATVTFEINAQGKLHKLFLYSSSGSFGYDEETLRVIEASSPFAIPPEHLLNKEGFLTLSVPFTVYF
jgi:TonB family protein